MVLYLERTQRKELIYYVFGPENSFPLNTLSTPNTVEGIVSKYPSVFNGVEKLKKFQVKIHIYPTVTPVIQPLRRLPYHTRAKVSEELDRLLELDITEPTLDEVVQRMHETKVFSKLDLKEGYHQLELKSIRGRLQLFQLKCPKEHYYMVCLTVRDKTISQMTS